jgi:benzoate-CoA ligase
MEHVLIEHACVREAAVIGVSVDNASRAKAFVVLAEEPPDRDGLAEELRALCRDRLRRYEYPHLVEYVEGLPRTPSGKIQRYKLRDL